MDIFGRCNGGAGLGVNSVPATGAVVAQSATTRSANNLAGPVVGPEHASTVGNTGGGGNNNNNGPAAPAEAATSQSRMQLTGASAPGNAASPESGVSPLADAYTKMTSDIFAERTLGDYMSEHPGELVRTGEFSGLLWIYRRERLRFMLCTLDSLKLNIILG